jgi:5S rRNA maturation endonuclease (ribonuclease M5)
MPHNLKALLPPQIKSKKRKRRSSKTDESDHFINCVKTYWRKLNEEILSQKQFISNGGLENLGGKSLCEMIRISQSKFMLVPFFLVFKLELYHDLQFLAFAQMYTYVLYCPDVFKLNWLLMKITRNLSSSYQIEVQHMECLLLLHSPMIIDMEELSKFEEDLDLINFLSNVDIVCGCIYMKEEHSISFIHEIVLNKEYNMFGDLMSFLLDCALAQITYETYHIISFCDLHKKIAKGKEWILLTDVDVNVDFVQYAKDLGWENKEVYKSTWSRSKRVPFATIAELSNELSFKEKQEFSPNERRTSKYFNDLKKIRNKFFSTRTCLNWKKTNPNWMK